MVEQSSWQVGCALSVLGRRLPFEREVGLLSSNAQLSYVMRSSRLGIHGCCSRGRTGTGSCNKFLVSRPLGHTLSFERIFRMRSIMLGADEPEDRCWPARVYHTATNGCLGAPFITFVAVAEYLAPRILESTERADVKQITLRTECLRFPRLSWMSEP